MNKKVIDNFMGEYRWLSNFHLCPIFYENIMYPSTEHAYQATKSLIPEIRESFGSDAWKPLTCGQAKRKGLVIPLREDWEQIKLKVMYEINYIKYTKHADLCQKLIDTEDAELIEKNSWGDKFWGVSNGGQNNLGKILMQIRKEIEDMII